MLSAAQKSVKQSILRREWAPCNINGQDLKRAFLKQSDVNETTPLLK